ncbi:somatostatin-1A-like [Hippoglossus hippoglossus]|uniref:somatostatin-1A-like n=1 Tax=Hippoglossus hippoglossus TaxID=8267 RepID=UPI00148CF739|nr:somatostatin-1A-like [Hippoglossus hippoglossus]
MAYIVCILALLCSVLCAAKNLENEQEIKDVQLLQDSLPWLKRLQDKQESTKTRTFADLISEFFKPENGITLQWPEDTEQQEKFRRGLGRSNATRKIGCKVFYWKSRASC